MLCLALVFGSVTGTVAFTHMYVCPVWPSRRKGHAAPVISKGGALRRTSSVGTERPRGGATPPHLEEGSEHGDHGGAAGMHGSHLLRACA